jgi:competence ComEA-like helix-hairpin-helix protein
MNSTMMKSLALFSVVALFAVVGCADANAATSTYLPVDEPCPFEDEQDRESMLELPDPLWELEQSGGEEAMDVDDDLDLEFSAGVADAADGNSAGERAAEEGLIDINRAGVDELTELPGIGPALAERIVEYRQQRRFEDPSQLMRIQGIGPATWEQIGSKVTVE